LSAILQVLTRYSANDPQFPVNDRSLFTGKSHAIGGAEMIRAIGWAAAKHEPKHSGRRVDAPQADATRQHFLSIGRRRFLSVRSLRGLLPRAKVLTTIR
jgi:hypothetical protein